ncbi:MAG: GDSL-type esterase/lipase family protein [Bacteroidales bacterium]|jgi:lysophospholipase L1-like esterase|nr:GDSL-type esterase/lipase family protein [Bacteroidales bacterium]
MIYQRPHCSLLLLFCVCIATTAKAQNSLSVLDTFPFIHYEKNVLLFADKSKTMQVFLSKFDTVVSTHQGNINIVQIGGSHVQAGDFPHSIRKNILLIYPDLITRRGFIFPYSAAPNCNNPRDYKISAKQRFFLTRNVYQNLDKELGVSGIAVSTGDSIVEIKVSMLDLDLHFETDTICILGYADKNSIIPTITIDSIEYNPFRIDSILRRFYYQVHNFQDNFTINIDNSALTDTFTITGLLLDHSKAGITYHSIGVNGAKSSSYLKCNYFTTDLELLRPDLVIFGLGINDAFTKDFDSVAFVQNYMTLMEKIRSVNPQCAFIFITNNDSYRKISRKNYEVNTNALIVQRQFYELAQKSDAVVWDQFEIMGGLKSMEIWLNHNLAQRDRVHFTPTGYQLLGNLFSEALLQVINQYQLEK